MAAQARRADDATRITRRLFSTLRFFLAGFRRLHLRLGVALVKSPAVARNTRRAVKFCPLKKRQGAVEIGVRGCRRQKRLHDTTILEQRRYYCSENDLDDDGIVVPRGSAVLSKKRRPADCHDGFGLSDENAIHPLLHRPRARFATCRCTSRNYGATPHAIDARENTEAFQRVPLLWGGRERVAHVPVRRDMQRRSSLRVLDVEERRREI